MAKRKLSGFDVWFHSQFGGLPPSPEEHQALIADVQGVKAQLAEMERKLRRFDALSSQWRAALYVWGMKDSDRDKWDKGGGV